MNLRRPIVAVAILATLAALFVLAGCGGGDSNSSSDAATSTAQAETMTHEDDETATTEDHATTGDARSTTEDDQTTTETGGGGTAAGTKTISIAVVGAQPEGGIKRATVKKGDKVVLVVTSDVADEVHLHGYDLMKDVSAGGTVRIAFVASIPGRFEAELEDRGVQIADLTVNP
jgi:hypothetical protein